MLLADLCARLPYRVKVKFKVNEVIESRAEIIYNIDGENSYITDGKSSYLTLDIIKMLFNNYLDDIKPYLFPLSSMTLEQRCKVRDLLPDKCEISFANSEIRFYGEDYHKIKLEQFEKLFNLFNIWHLDYRGLIPMGLAINATELNIY